MDLNYFLFILIESCQTTPPPSQRHKQIQEKYCAVVLSRNGPHATKYLHFDICNTGHDLALQ